MMNISEQWLHHFHKLGEKEFNRLNDVTFVIGNEESGIERFDCIRALIAVHSHIFARMLCGGMIESNLKEIIIHDVSPIAFDWYKKYCYGLNPSINETNIVSLFHFSDKYCIGTMYNSCISYVCKVACPTDSISTSDSMSTFISIIYQLLNKNLMSVVDYIFNNGNKFSREYTYKQIASFKKQLWNKHSGFILEYGMNNNGERILHPTTISSHGDKCSLNKKLVTAFGLPYLNRYHQIENATFFNGIYTNIVDDYNPNYTNGKCDDEYKKMMKGYEIYDPKHVAFNKQTGEIAIIYTSKDEIGRLPPVSIRICVWKQHVQGVQSSRYQIIAASDITNLPIHIRWFVSEMKMIRLRFVDDNIFIFKNEDPGVGNGASFAQYKLQKKFRSFESSNSCFGLGCSDEHEFEIVLFKNHFDEYWNEVYVWDIDVTSPQNCSDYCLFILFDIWIGIYLFDPNDLNSSLRWFHVEYCKLYTIIIETTVVVVFLLCFCNLYFCFAIVNVTDT